MVALLNDGHCPHQTIAVHNSQVISIDFVVSSLHHKLHRLSLCHFGSSLFDAIFQLKRTSRVAVLYEGREITYEELRELTLRAAEPCARCRSIARDRVAILLNDSPEFVASFVASSRWARSPCPSTWPFAPRPTSLLNDAGRESPSLRISHQFAVHQDRKR